MCDPGEADSPPVLFALVGYVPGALGQFLSQLRAHLVPDCQLESHVTVLPPRVLNARDHRLSAALDAHLVQADPFEVRLGGVEIFPVTNVIHLAVQGGWDHLLALHLDLNRGDLAFPEPFEFHPHITLAQELPPTLVQETFQRAADRWDAWRGPRTFPLRNLTFVRNSGVNSWHTVSEHPLRRSGLRKTG